jgi:hypothetical protein
VERISVQNANGTGTIYLDLSATDFNSYTPYGFKILPSEYPDYYSIRFSDLFSLDEEDRYTAAQHITLVKIFPGVGVEYEKRNVSLAGGVLTVAFQEVSRQTASVFRLTVKGGPEGLTDSTGAYLPEDVFIFFVIEPNEE